MSKICQRRYIALNMPERPLFDEPLVAGRDIWQEFVNLVDAISDWGARNGSSRANGEFAVLDLIARPAMVMGPLGPITADDLPSSCTSYWVCRRKAEVLAAIDGGMLDIDEACARYRLSHEEIAAWRRSVERAGLAGLRVTKLKRYRDQSTS